MKKMTVVLFSICLAGVVLQCDANSAVDAPQDYFIGENIRSNTHQVERITVTFIGNGKYKVDLMVLWQAITKEDRFVYFRAHQVWTLDNGKKSKWPRILTYIVKEAPRPAETPK